jgi:PAS domain S-box-containing protein
VRAIAAGGHLTVGARGEGGELIRVGVDASSRPGPTAPAGDAAVLTGSHRRAPSAGAAPTLGRRVAAGALLAITYVIVGVLALAYLREVDALGNTARMAHAAPWIPSGVHAVGVMLGGWQLWPAVFLSYTALWWGVSHDTLVSALVGAAGRTVAVLVIAWFIRRLRGQPAFNRLSEVALLAVAAAIGYALVIPLDVYSIGIAGSPSESLSAAELSLAPEAAGTLLGIPAAKLYPALRWWLNAVIGVVLTVPVVTAWTREHARRLRARPLESLAWCAVLAFALYAILAAAAPSLKLAVLGLGIVCAAWGAVRVGAGLAYFATLAMSLAATASYGLGIGVLATPGDGDGVAALWSFMILLVVTAHLLTTLLVESDAAQQSARELARQYRTLFDAVPHALFAYARDGGEIRLANRAVGERFGYRAEDVVGRSLADLEVASDAAAWLTPSSAWPRRRTRFLTREGTTVDVELTQVPVELDGEPGVLCFAIDVTEQAQLHARMLEATELERRHLMRELHDDLGQLLTGLALGSEALSSAVERGQRPDLESTVFIASAAEEARRTALRVLSGISPLQECDGDLLAALRRMPARLPPAEAARLRLEITAPAAIRLGLVQREHLYKIAQEAVTNAVKHARARQITVSASVEADTIQVCVTDDGIGFDVARCAGGVGLESMRLRASALGGVFAIRSTEGEGTILCCRAPQPRAAA